jgi:hypothetical protein
MRNANLYLVTFLGFFFAVTVALAQSTSTSANENFVIDPTRPYVYLQLDHFGSGKPWRKEEPPYRLWFKLVNNCEVPITVRTTGVPEGTPKNEVGIMDHVVLDPPDHGVTVIAYYQIPQLENSPGTTRAALAPETEDKKHSRQMPDGYWYEVGSLQTILPGKSVLFSVPANHVSEHWHSEIPFEFQAPHSNGPLHEDPVGRPSNLVAYYLWDLPREIQDKIKKM